MFVRHCVGDIMTRDPLAVQPHTLLSEAVDLLFSQRISGLPVVGSAGQLVGILTEQDCLRVAYADEYYSIPSRSVGEAMTTSVRTIEATADVMKALRIFLDESFRRLPVVESGRLVGVVSRRDVLGALCAMR